MNSDTYAELTRRAENAREESIIRERKANLEKPMCIWDAGYFLGLAHGLEEARDLALRASVDAAG